MCSCLVKVSLVDINISRGRLRRQFPFHKRRNAVAVATCRSKTNNANLGFNQSRLH